MRIFALVSWARRYADRIYRQRWLYIQPRQVLAPSGAVFLFKMDKLPEINSKRWLSLEDLPGEEWATIPGYQNAYMVSTMGRVKCIGLCTNRVKRGVSVPYNRKPFIKVSKDNGHGYHTVVILNDHHYVHRLVATAFVPNLFNKPEVDHINEVKSDNRAVNLRWVTRKENMANSRTYKRIKDRGLSFRKPILQINPLSGSVIKEWSGIMEAGDALGVNRVVIGEVANQARNGIMNTAGGYVFVFKADYDKSRDYRVFRERKISGAGCYISDRCVVEYISNTIYRVFSSTTIAAKYLGCTKSGVSKICRIGREKKKVGRKFSIKCGVLMYLKDTPQKDRDYIISNAETIIIFT